MKTLPLKSSPLANAVKKFNDAFGYGASLPIDGETFLNLILIARMRQRADIADEMQTALEEEPA